MKHVASRLVHNRFLEVQVVIWLWRDARLWGGWFRGLVAFEVLKPIAENVRSFLYNGTIGEKLIKDVRSAGGILTMEDLRNYDVKVTDAVEGTRKGFTIFGMPPPSNSESEIEDHGTSHFCIVDADRNAVSMTTTVNFPWGGVRTETLSSMTPVIIVKAIDMVNNWWRLYGGSGGIYIIPAVIQVFLNHFILGMEPLDAVQSPRVYHKLMPNVVDYENWTVIDGDHIELSCDRKEFLRERGHILQSKSGEVIQHRFNMKYNNEMNVVSTEFLEVKRGLERNGVTGWTCALVSVSKTSLAANARRNNEKALNILLSAIPDRHLLSFHDAVDARSLWKAIKARFGGNEASKKMQKNLCLKSKLSKQFFSVHEARAVTLKQSTADPVSYPKRMLWKKLNIRLQVAMNNSKDRKFYEEDRKIH
ncbi:gamma-glutamyltranspeptidase 1 [Tanacetum coccineum]|uniref:Gamma-glutamyltranspeptidase 1 n=1 Tax=Tanacetum coccineum TaxID=301880 RepID=A0ABQ5CLP8_9ASTR